MEYDEQMLLLKQWNEAVAKVELVAKPEIADEMRLRKLVMAEFFPDAKEGVNSRDMGMGWVLKGTLKIERKLDEAALPAVKESLRAIGVNADTLVRYKPELETKVYKALSEQAQKVFDAALTIKPGSPTMELLAPKEKK